MGNAFRSTTKNDTYNVWARQTEDNQYALALCLDHFKPGEENTLRSALGMFRREVYMFSLGRKYVAAEVLYLYDGYSRLARAQIKDDVLHLTFPNLKLRRAWESAPELLAPEQWPLAQDGFESKFNRPVCDDDEVTMRYRRVDE